MDIPQSPKTILVLGATGHSGRLTVLELLRLQQNVIIYCRAPDKLPLTILSSPLVQIITGSLTDADTLSTAFTVENKPIHAVISLVGPNLSPSSLPWNIKSSFSDFQKLLMSKMREFGVKRILTMGTISIVHERDKFSLLRWLAILPVKILVYPAYREIIRISKIYAATSTDDIEWTVFRVGGLIGTKPRDAKDEHAVTGNNSENRSEGKELEAHAGFVGDGKSGISVHRTNLGLWLAVEATREKGQEKWVGEMPLICSVKAGV